MIEKKEDVCDGDIREELNVSPNAASSKEAGAEQERPLIEDRNTAMVEPLDESKSVEFGIKGKRENYVNPNESFDCSPAASIPSEDYVILSYRQLCL